MYLLSNLQNCSGACRVSSSQYNTCSALYRGSAMESRTNSTHPPSGPAGHHQLRKRNFRSMCAGFAAHRRPGLSKSATGSRQCLAAVQPGPASQDSTSCLMSRHNPLKFVFLLPLFLSQATAPTVHHPSLVSHFRLTRMSLCVERMLFRCSSFLH